MLSRRAEEEAVGPPWQSDVIAIDRSSTENPTLREWGGGGKLVELVLHHLLLVLRLLRRRHHLLGRALRLQGDLWPHEQTSLLPKILLLPILLFTSDPPKSYLWLYWLVWYWKALQSFEVHISRGYHETEFKGCVTNPSVGKIKQPSIPLGNFWRSKRWLW